MATTTNAIAAVASSIGVDRRQVEAVSGLLVEGATVPFIARYRKERTGGLDEVQIISVRDGLARIEALEKRREAILASLAEQGVADESLLRKIRTAPALAQIEDLYLPYRPKRRTRATMAREKGLEPLADILMNQGGGDPAQVAAAFVNPEAGVANAEEALAGARDIIAESVSEDAEARASLREVFRAKAAFESKLVKGKEAEAAKYASYHDWSEPVRSAPSHRVLAMLRGMNEGCLKVHALPREDDAIALLDRRFVRGRTAASEHVATAVRDAWKRLLAPSLENELVGSAKEKADAEAISVFAKNLRHLLLASPLGGKRVLALDPGFRTGCKLVCLDETGALLHHEAIFPLPPQNRAKEAADRVKALGAQHSIEFAAVGNGTGGREAQAFLKDTLAGSGVPVVSVNEAGASVYSASEAGREEFPDQDVTVRGAVSIGRRLQDPLAELVKIDPKSIGVGQYQHDVSQPDLQRALDDVVESCVNTVGVDVNTASARLLRYVSGLGEKLAKAVVARRDAEGPFETRSAFRKVKGLGPRAFEQCAGFLRIRDAEDPLDSTAVHPESYAIVRRMAADLGCTVADLISDPAQRARIDPKRFVTAEAGLPTITDILDALGKAGRDPRESFEPAAFDDSVREIADLKPGMELIGVVTNVTAFGAFVDVGVHHDGLVHVSKLADRYVRDPHEVVHPGQQVRVRVVDVDLDRKRIGLTMKTS